MRKLIIGLMVAGLILSAKSYVGYTALATSDSVGTTEADTIIVNFNTYRAKVAEYKYQGAVGDLKAYSLLTYKFVSTAGTPAIKFVLDLSPDSTNWVESITYQDSLKTETWNTDTLPTNVKFYKYGRFIF